MRVLKPIGIVAALLLQLLPTFADDVITNIMSPIASYQYPNNFSSEVLTNGGIMSPIASYQYYEWPGNDILNLQSSPMVSYYYQFLDAPVLNIISTTRTPTTDETTPAYLISLPPPPHLMAYHGGIFTTNLASVNPNQMSIVLTHGWIPLYPLTGLSIFNPNGVEDWPTTMAAQLRSENSTANIVAWNWENAAKSSVTDPEQAGSQSPYEGTLLGQALLNVLGANYSKPIHFVGHSFGTLVNAYAANYLQGANFASEPVSPTPWPAANMQMTLFDEAEVGANVNFTLNSQDLDALADANANLLTTSPYYHPLPKQFAWADNYVSAVGLLQSGAANVILTNEFPASAPDPFSWFGELGVFHGYPMPWYEETIQDDGASLMGFRWSFEKNGGFSGAPSVGSVYVQSGSEWNLTATNWNYGTNFLNQRFQEYRGGVVNSINNQVPGLVTANGSVNGQIVGALPAFDAFILSFFTSSANNSPAPQFKAHPLGQPADSGSSTNVPAYAWMPLVVPTNAISMSFDYIIQGDWQSDSLAAAFNGTNVLLIAGNVIQTNIIFSSGAIDVSTFAGQTNEFFIGIVGGTSTNAQLTVENLAFAIASPPSLQAQTSGGNLILSWPMTSQNFNLQTTTNLANPNSWMTLTNVPAIVNLQNTITNPIVGSQGFYRLIQSQ
jgi:pimeloyl-ACP methyl ester carboxylesterase